jgi:protein kinase A
VVHTAQGDGVPDAHAKFYGAAVLLAIAYLHSKDIAYRDMKPENCLIDKDGYPKLVDFGFAKVITGKSYTLCGTPEYLAPELVLAKGHNKAVDYWALGILLYEMEAGYSPFSDPQGMDQVVICKNIVKGRLVFPRNFNADCKDLVKRLLSREIATRLGNLKGGCDDIKSQRWFQSMDFDLLLKRGLKPPWVPKVSGITDTSTFDPYGADDEVDNSHFVDRGDWDK